MKLFLSLIIATLFLVSDADAQKIFATRNGKVTFSAPSDEDVTAVNNEVTSRMADNGQMTFSLLIKGFRFKFAEMQEHFNDQYVESTKFPRADFKGTISNLKDVNFSKDGSYKATVNGDLTLHGVTKKVTVNGTIDIKDGKPAVTGRFTILMNDFNVSAKAVTDKVSVDVSCQYQ